MDFLSFKCCFLMWVFVFFLMAHSDCTAFFKIYWGIWIPVLLVSLTLILPACCLKLMRHIYAWKTVLHDVLSDWAVCVGNWNEKEVRKNIGGDDWPLLYSLIYVIISFWNYLLNTSLGLFLGGDDFLYTSLDLFVGFLMWSLTCMVAFTFTFTFDLLRLRDWVCMHYLIIYIICWELGLIICVNLFFCNYVQLVWLVSFI